MEWTETTVTRWFTFEDFDGSLLGVVVFPYCPKCGRFVKTGNIELMGNGNAILTGWICSKHGEVQPDTSSFDPEPTE